ncbi:hypothetical protein ACLB1G_02790 [Oxalobacteraceae bacterium A2-2]
MNRRHTYLAAACLLGAPGAHAGRPMTIEDAAITPAGLCQVEAYGQHDREHNETWITPACTLAGWLELAVGMAHQDGRQRYTRLQGKTVFREVQPDGWGIGLVLADQYRPGEGMHGEWSANVPLTFSLRGDALLLHLNAGWLRGAQARRHDATWGLGAEFKLTEKAAVTAETYGQQRAGSRYQFGASYALAPDRWQVDATWGNRMARGASEHVVTLGLVYQSAPGR